jgi:hypothetical protein
MPKLTVALNIPKGDGDFIVYALHIATCMGASPWFPSPPVPISTLLAHIATLDAAQAASLTRAHGTAAARDAERSIVHGLLRQERMYVETVANQHPTDGEAIVASSGMSTKDSAGPTRLPFSCKQLKTSGSVCLSVRDPGVKAFFEWQWSTDGVHWVDLGGTLDATLDVHGLTPGTRYLFRYRMQTKLGVGDWSDPIALLVV